MKIPRTGPVIIALLAMYLIWGSTYLAIKIAVESLPPLLMAAGRFLLASSLLFCFLRGRRTPLPTRREWLNAAIIGGLMMGGGVGGVSFAEQWINSGLAAVVVATVPLWAVLFTGLTGRWPTRFEWLGLVAGLLGVVLLNLESNLRANPLGAMVLLAAPASWAFGSVLSKRLALPAGAMGFAAEMLAGGAILLILGLLRGERISTPVTAESIIAWLYLVFLGSLITFSAYMYLLKRVSITVATSYAYVNPVIAVLLGVALAGEQISGTGIVAMLVILGAVVLILFGQSALARRLSLRLLPSLRKFREKYGWSTIR